MSRRVRTGAARASAAARCCPDDRRAGRRWARRTCRRSRCRSHCAEEPRSHRTIALTASIVADATYEELAARVAQDGVVVGSSQGDRAPGAGRGPSAAHRPGPEVPLPAKRARVVRAAAAVARPCAWLATSSLGRRSARVRCPPSEVRVLEKVDGRRAAGASRARPARPAALTATTSTSARARPRRSSTAPRPAGRPACSGGGPRVPGRVHQRGPVGRHERPETGRRLHDDGPLAAPHAAPPRMPYTPRGAPRRCGRRFATRPPRRPAAAERRFSSRATGWPAMACASTSWNYCGGPPRSEERGKRREWR